ncbi:MAG: hypothetical protein ABSF28_03330 [Terracidiphilus sp.]
MTALYLLGADHGAWIVVTAFDHHVTPDGHDVLFRRSWFAEDDECIHGSRTSH